MPEREQKPRNTGIIVIADYGTGLADIERQISESSNLIDLVKISISALHSKTLIRERLGVYKKSGISVLMSGTFFNEIPQELHQGMTKAIDPFYDYDPMM